LRTTAQGGRMCLLKWRKGVRRKSNNPRRSSTPAARGRTARDFFKRLQLEPLESRLAPATFTWNGAGADARFSTGANWVGGVAPTGSAASFDDLVFSASAVRKVATNNLNGATFKSFTISGSNYQIGGNAITLGAPPGGAVIIVAAGATNNQILSTLDITFGGGATDQHSISIASGGNLKI